MARKHFPSAAPDLTLNYILDNLSDGAMLVEAETNKIAAVNPLLRRMLRCTKDDFLNKSVISIHPKEAHALAGDFYAGIKLKKPGSLKNIPVKKKGSSIFYADISASVMQGGGKTYLLAVFRETSRTPESGSGKLDELLKTIFDTSADGILLVDNNDRTIYYNRHFLKMWNISPDIAATFNDSKMIDSVLSRVTDPSGFKTRIKELKKTGKSTFDEITFRDGKVFERFTSPIRTGGRKTGRIWYFRDITAREKSAEAFRQSEERFRTLFMSMSDGFYLSEPVFDDNGEPYDFRFLEVNPRFEQISMMSRDQLIGRRFRDMVEIKDPSMPWLTAYFKVVRTGKPQRLKYFLPYPGGEKRYFTNYAFRLDTGKIAVFIMDRTESMQTAKELEDTRLLLNTAIMQTPVPIVMASAPDNVIRIANSACIEYLGIQDEPDVTGKQITGKNRSWQDYDENGYPIPSSNMPLDQALRGIVIKNREQCTVRKDGTIRWNSANASPVRNSEGDIIAAFAAFPDITERKHAEELLRKNEGMLRSILEAAPVGIGFLMDRIFIKVNPAITRITGYTEDDLLGNSTRIIYPDDEEFNRIGVELYDKMRTEGLGTAETRIMRKDGSILYGILSLSAFDPEEPSAGVTATLLDITERKKSEEALKKSEEILKSLFDAAPVGISMMVDRKFIKPNNAMCRMLGYSEEELVGRDELFLYQDKDEYDRVGVELFNQVVTGGLGHAETRYKRRDGAVIDVLIYLSPYNQGNTAGGEALVVLDITETKKMHEEKTRLEDLLLRSQKMEALGTMAGGIAHDFNNILTGIFGYSELCLTVDGIPPETEYYVRGIITAAERAKDLVIRILTFSRKSEHKLMPIIPKYILKEVQKLLRASTPAEIALNFSINSEAAIMAESTLLHQVIMNLCSNAIYAMQSGPGSIDVTLEDLKVDAEFALLHPGLNPGRHIVIRVADTGSGIPQEAMEHIFEPFYTTKPQGEGTGLGLSVVHGIVNRLNGTISVYSEPGKGTAFNIILPVIEDETVEVIDTDSIIKGGAERILLVDDEEIVINAFGIILKNLGYEVKSFTGSREALKEFSGSPDAYDIVITDYSMPHMTGIELVRKIKEIRKDIPVILNSGFFSKSMEEAADAAGINILLTKPVSTYQIDNAIRRAMSGGREE